MSTEAIREKFESWLLSNDFTQSDLSKINGEYIIPSVQLAWLSRQQAVKDMEDEIAELTKERDELEEIIKVFLSYDKKLFPFLLNPSQWRTVKSLSTQGAKASEWISVEDGHCEFDEKYYVELKDGRLGIGSWSQCVDGVRFNFNGESRAICMWPEDSRPINYTELPKGPSE